MNTSVKRFLDGQPPSLTRERLGERASDYFESKVPTPYGEAWRALTKELGLPCPEALVQLGDAMAHQFVYFRFRGHQYAMLTPKQAGRKREYLIELAEPELEPFTRMIPVFSEDGDHLMLDAKGAFWALPHDDSPPEKPAVKSLDVLLDEAQMPAVNL